MRAAARLILGLALAGCLERDGGGEVEGHVSLTSPSGHAVPLGPVEVRFIPEEVMAPFVEAKLAEVRAELEHAEAERAALKTRLKQLDEERRLADQALRRMGAETLRRRLELQRHPQELESRRALLAAQEAAARQRAIDVKLQTEAAQRDAERAAAASARVADGSLLLAGLPAPVAGTTTRLDGTFDVRLAPGRYAVVATTRTPDGALRAWLLWTRVEAGGVDPLWLDDGNLSGAECGACVLPPSRLTR